VLKINPRSEYPRIAGPNQYFRNMGHTRNLDPDGDHYSSPSSSSSSDAEN
jgi:hypothetical protein